MYTLAGDYEPVSVVEQFTTSSAEGEQVCFNVTILNDDIFEKTQEFSLNLESETNVMVPHPQVLVTIFDNEGKQNISCIK